MRKECKQMKTVELATVQGYHQGGSWTNHESYAFTGFKSNKYFTSDRFIPLDSGFNRPDGQPLQGFGLEIETECSQITDSDVLAEVYDRIIFSHFPADLFKMQHDGSLGGRSNAECITQVMTQQFIRNHYRDFKLMYDTYFPAFGIGCDNGRCGMHVNISNACFGKTLETQTEAIRKFYYMVNKHYEFMRRLVYRNGSTGYCAVMNYPNARNLDLNTMPSAHCNCINGSHFGAGRIELRLVGGQKNFACFRNTMESVFWLVKRARSISWRDCDDLVKIFSGCNQYVFDRIKSKCKYYDTITEEQVNAIRDTVKPEDLI